MRCNNESSIERDRPVTGAGSLDAVTEWVVGGAPFWSVLMSTTDQTQKPEDDLSTMERFTDLISDIITTVSEHKSDLLEETSSITSCIDKIAGKLQ